MKRHRIKPTTANSIFRWSIFPLLLLEVKNLLPIDVDVLAIEVGTPLYPQRLRKKHQRHGTRSTHHPPGGKSGYGRKPGLDAHRLRQSGFVYGATGFTE